MMKYKPTYCGQKCNQGQLVPVKPFIKEGYAILSCGGTEVVLSYSALHLISGWIAEGSHYYKEVKISEDIFRALNAICCEASIGKTSSLKTKNQKLQSIRSLGTRGNKKQSQDDRIWNFLMGGNSITTIEAFNIFGVTRLAAVIHRLHERASDLSDDRHMEIESKKIEASSGKWVARYKIVDKGPSYHGTQGTLKVNQSCSKIIYSPDEVGSWEDSYKSHRWRSRHRAVELLDKGYELWDEVEPLLEKYGSINNVPDKDD